MCRRYFPTIRIKPDRMNINLVFIILWFKYVNYYWYVSFNHQTQGSIISYTSLQWKTFKRGPGENQSMKWFGLIGTNFILMVRFLIRQKYDAPSPESNLLKYIEQVPVCMSIQALVPYISKESTNRSALLYSTLIRILWWWDTMFWGIFFSS